MKIILQGDVVKLGKAGETKEVSDGFARNYLFPRGLAVIHTGGTARLIEARRTVLAKKRELATRQTDQLKADIEKQELSFSVNVDDRGELYGSITKGQIVKALRANAITLPADAKIELNSPLKALGVFNVPLRLPYDVTAQVRVTLVASGASSTK
ncbi:MAG: 50S ribosomal protein L9 [Elusimicrobia bacterium]|nr:50S ribosomal protein L9 [Elusimicrobiota bacterium]